MKLTITVDGVSPEDMAWLKREARQREISVEELVRRLIREERAKPRRRSKPSEAFRRFFGPEHGVELPARQRYGHTPVTFEEKTEA